MILTKYLKIKIKTTRDRNKYNKLGYDCNIGDSIYLKIEHLTKGSHYKIDVKCENCGKENEIKFQTYIRNTKDFKYDYYCNNKECINKKREIVLQDKYGVSNVFELKETKNKIKETNLEKYGVENPQQNKNIKEKTENTNLKKYGFKNVFQSEEIKEKIKKTNLEKYGVEYPQQSKEIRSKYQSYRKSKNEIKMYDFIKEFYDKEILTISKKQIGLELDIYLPDLKLAFEFNGIYWHNEITKSKNYHKEKSDLCEKKGIQLIHIWEDDWNYKQEIIKSMILNKLGKTPNKIYGRKTIIKEITDNKLIREFLENNHIQGFVGSSIKIGLYYDNKLVSLMCFKKLKNINNYELNRYCNKINTNVIGGASKLFRYFINNYEYNTIKTFADRSISNGNLYYNLGFKFECEIRPDYSYTINNNKIRSHKFNFRKHKLVKQGFDPNKSEHEIMLERKIYRIYDAGKLKFIYKQK